MMRGRKPTPTSVKMPAGNPGKRALNHHEPKPAAAILDCPVELSAAAKAESDRRVTELAPLRMLTNLHRAALAAYCESYALRVDAMAAVRKYGTMAKSPSGYPMQSPYVAIANKQVEIMLRIAAEFGFTPASRRRIAVPPEREPDLFDFGMRDRVD